MPSDRDYRDEGTIVPAGAEPTGDARAPGPAASDAPEDGAPAGTPAGADEPGSLPAGPVAADATQPAETVPGRRPPLITAIEIENFKGIGRPVRIELRPVTLLFGGNSAGKSTVLHALCYAHEILSHRNVDVRKTELGGDQIDLGGFQQFVHRHDLKRSVRLRFELYLYAEMLPDLGGTWAAMPKGWSFLPSMEFVDLADAETGWLELTVTWKTELDKPIVSGYEVGIDGRIVGRITASMFSSVAPLLADASHPMFAYMFEYGVDGERSDAPAKAVGQVREDSGSGRYGRGLRSMKVIDIERSSALPSLHQHLWIREDKPFVADPSRFYYGLSTLLVGIGSLVRDELARFGYLGPLRKLNPGAGVKERGPERRGWADGSAAWAILNHHARVNQSNPRTLVKVVRGVEAVRQVSDWLSQEDRLDTGYKLEVAKVVHLPADAPLVGGLNKGVEGEKLGGLDAGEEKTSGTESAKDIVKKAPDEVAALLDRIADAPVHSEIQIVETRTGMPVRTSDIGVGISQLLPVVVAALNPDGHAITAIEQPELHLHPRLQVEIGDLFAERAARGGVLLIETHSEHLLLRIMKRMRQTNDGTLPDGAPQVRPEDVNVLFVEQYDEQTLIREMPLNERGELVKAWPGGFFEEDLREIF